MLRGDVNMRVLGVVLCTVLLVVKATAVAVVQLVANGDVIIAVSAIAIILACIHVTQEVMEHNTEGGKPNKIHLACIRSQMNLH